MEYDDKMGVAKEILRTLLRAPRQTPGSLQQNMGLSISAVKSALVTLTDLELVEPITRGLYQITDLGKYVLNQILKKED